MRIAIEGVGCIGAFGFGLEDFARALTSPPSADVSGPFPVLPQADVGVLGAFLAPRAMRQMNHFTRMAMCAAFGALADAGLEAEDVREAGMILASGYGPAGPTFAFLDSIEEYGEKMASPLIFSHSVHNIPAAGVAMKLGMEGPCASFCQLETSVAAGLLAAHSWLAEDRVSRVLFGAVDEMTALLPHATAHIVRDEGCRNHPARRAFPLGEGAVFFCLSAGAAKRGVFTETTMRAVDASGEAGVSFADAAKHMAAYGNMPVAQAFDALAALVAFEKGETAAVCSSYSPAGAASTVRLEAPRIA